MTLSRDGLLCDQANASTASIFTYTIQGLVFQGRPVVSDGSSWWLYMGQMGGWPGGPVGGGYTVGLSASFGGDSMQLDCYACPWPGCVLGQDCMHGCHTVAAAQALQAT
jgi:hypothetical protein